MTVRHLELCAILLTAFLGADCSHAHAQSFNCRYAKSPDEVLICQDQELSALDERLSGIYFSVHRILSGEDRTKLERDERAWLQGRENCGRKKECVTLAIERRIQDLMALSQSLGLTPPTTRNPSVGANPSEPSNGAPTASSRGRCLVADPTGTPLNVRTIPNGKVVGTLSNGVPVVVLDHVSQNGKTWVYIGRDPDQVPLGWVFRDYVNCFNAAQRRAQRDQPIEGYAFDYHDEPSHTVSGLDECISSCRNASQCVAYVFFKTKRLCRLMTSCDAALERNPDAISGYNAYGPVNQAPPGYPSNGSFATISLKSDGGTYVVPVQINGAITLDFVIDSGASDVSVPADVVSTLIRTGTIRDSDFIGKQTYILADGSKAPSAVFMIRSLKVGNTVIENVKGDIAPAQASLLLGQSFLQHFKSWSINNATHELILETGK